MIRILALLMLMLSLGAVNAHGADIRDRVTHDFAENEGVKIHYASLGEGPLVLMIHGFPDFWYSWRYQMEALSADYRCVAVDQRGYNQSDKPTGQENYDVLKLVGDAIAVIDHLGEEKAIVVGHDWGGFVAWFLAAYHPDRVERLIICNLPHPKGISRELTHNPEQQANSAYARAFQQEGAHLVVTEEMLAMIVAPNDAEARAVYLEAFKNSDKEAMLAYYKQNYPREPYSEDTRDVPLIQMPVLVFHGLLDVALHANGLNQTWEWVNAPLQIVTVPGASHWVHHEAKDLVNATIRDWLARPMP
jgi:pimeloyl-ACP methyl ester carboxylesterase